MVDLDTIVSLCKRRGFIFQSSEIYGGLGSAWDYGPLGVEFKNNVKRLWWRDTVQRRDDVVGLDAAITMHPTVWKASGHADHFADLFTSCQECKRNYRADQLLDSYKGSKWIQSIEKVLEGPAGQKDRYKAFRNWLENDGRKLAPGLSLVKQRPDDNIVRTVADIIASKNYAIPAYPHGVCPACGGQLSEPKPANLMLVTHLGPVRETAVETYLRPETAQGIFVNFENVLQASRKKLPFGIAQVGKSFRNEITPGNFTFRTREFEQMEIEYFVKPGTDEEWHQKWIDERFAWYQRYGIRKENIKLREHEQDKLTLNDGTVLQGKVVDERESFRLGDRVIPKTLVQSYKPGELAHYAKRCVDIEYLFPMGWSELEGIANRTDYDLKQHAKFSGKTLEYFDEETKSKVVPYVIEPSAGADRSALAFLVDAYHEEEVKGEKRVVLRFHPELAPIKVAVLPLLKKNEKIVATAKSIVARLRERWPLSVYDDTAAIGKLYRRQDEVGTPFCVTVDVQTVGDEKADPDNKVTIRERDSMQQIRVPIAELERVMGELMAGRWPAQFPPSTPGA